MNMLRDSFVTSGTYPNPSSSFYATDLANALNTIELISKYTDIKKLENAFVSYDHTKYNIHMYRSAIIDSPSADTNLIHKIIQKTIEVAGSNAPLIFDSAMIHPNTSDTTLNLILENRGSTSVVEVIAKHPNTSYETLKKMYNLAKFDCPRYIPVIIQHPHWKTENIED